MFRIALGLLGVVGLVAALPILFSGGSLLWFDAVFTDAEGFVNSGELDVEVDGFALLAGPAEIEGLPEFPDAPIELSGLATIRIRAENTDPAMGVFIGAADVAALEAYLGNSPYAIVDEVDEEGFVLVYQTEVDPVSQTEGDGTIPSLPGDQPFWTASAQGLGEQVLEWDLENGDVSFVVMNENASDGLAFTTSVGVRVPILQPIGVGLAIGGGALLALSTILLAIAL